MMERTIVSLANKFLSTYIKGLDRTDLSLSILRGEVILHNVSVNTAFLDSLNLPLSVKEIYVGTINIRFPWLSLNKNPIAVEIDDIYVLLTPLDPANELVTVEEIEKVEEAVKTALEEEVKAVIESESEPKPELEPKPEPEKKEVKEEKKAEKKPAKEVDPDAITDFSGAFDLATALVNNFTFTLRRLHVRIEGNPNSPIPMFSLGVALESIELNTMEPSESVSVTDVRKSFDMNGLTIYWCMNNTSLLAQAEEETCLTAMRSFFKDMAVEEKPEEKPEEKSEEEEPAKASIITYNPDDRLLDDMHLRVVIQGDLRKIEDRQRSVEESLELTCSTLALDEKANTTHALVLEHIRQLDLTAELAKPAKEFAKDLIAHLPEEEARLAETVALARKVAQTLWETSKTPRPMLSVSVELDKIDLEIEKSQYENIICFADDFLASLPASKPAEKEETPVIEEVKEEEKEEEPKPAEEPKEPKEPKEPGMPHYVYGVLSFACHAANYLLTSYLPFVCLMVLLSTTPVMIFRHFFQWLMVMGAVAVFVVIAFLRTKKRVQAYNARVDREAHFREKLVSASVLMKAFELRLNNDMVGEETEHIMALCVNDLSVQANVASNVITASVVLRDVHIVDGVSTKLQNRDRQLMCVCDVDEQGCPSNLVAKPLLSVNVTMAMASSPTYAESKQDILVGVDLGQVNLVVSRVFIYSLLRFIAPSEKMKRLLRRAAVKADEKALELKEKSDVLVEAPPKPLPADWERKSIVLQLNMDSASVMLDSETEGLVLKAGISDLSVGVTISAAQLHVICELYDVYVRDCTHGCGLYPDFVAIAHKDGGKTGSDNFLNATIDLNNDDRWPNYPGYAIAASCSLGSPVLTVRMRFIQELLNYITSGPIMDGLALLSNPEPEVVVVEEIVETAEEEPEVDLNIAKNLKDCAINMGKQYIVSNADLEEESETHIIQSLQGIAHNVKRHFIVPNPNDDNVPTEIPKLSVSIGKTTIHIPRASDSEDKVTMEVGAIEIGNTAPELKVREEGVEVVKKSVVYTLNKIHLSIAGVALSTLIEGRCQTIMGKINLDIDVVVAVKVELALVLSRIVLAVSEDQIFTLIRLLTQNLAEQAVAIKALPAKETKKVEKVEKVEKKAVEEIVAEEIVAEEIKEEEKIAEEAVEEEKTEEATEEVVEEVVEETIEEEKTEKVMMVEEEEPVYAYDNESIDSNRSGLMPRCDSLTSLNSALEAGDMYLRQEELPPKENNSAIADRIHANIMLEGVTIELFRGSGGYDGVCTSQEMYEAVGTMEGSLATISIEDFGVKAYMHNMNISASVSLASFFVKDSRPESPMLPSFRTLVQLGDESKPAFTVLVSLQNTELGGLRHVDLPAGHTMDEPVMDIGASIFLGQVSVLPSPFIFVLLNWATALGAKVGETLAAKTAEKKKEESESESVVVVVEEPVEEPVEEEEIAIETEEVEVAEEVAEEPAKETKPAALIPNVVFKMHMDRMALYLVEDTTSEATPVFLFCFGVEVSAHVTPALDIFAGVSVNSVRASRSDVNLRLLPTNMCDAIYPFGLNVDVAITDNIKNINAQVKGSEMVIRLGILDAKLIINAAGHILSEMAPAAPAAPAAPVEETKEEVKKEIKKEVKETKKEEVKKETKKEEVMHILANVLLEKISFILVNDAKAFELPVLQFNVDKVKVDAAIGSNLYAHVGVVFSSEYYKATHTLWEPFLENWDVKVHVKQVKDVEEMDPFMPSEAAPEVASSTMHVAVEGSRMLNINVTATLLSSLMEVLGDFSQCLSGARETNDAFFVYMNNVNDLPTKYIVEDDGDIGYLMEELEVNAEMQKHEDAVVFADVVDVVETYRTNSRWMEFHSHAPHIRMYRQVPLLMDTKEDALENLVVEVNNVTLPEATCGHIFPIAFIAQEHGEKLYVEQLNDERAEKLVERANSLKEELSIHHTITMPPSSFKKMKREIPEGGVASSLPAHPSLALFFLKKDSRQIAPRLVRLQVEGCQSVECKVDREGVYYCPLMEEVAVTGEEEIKEGKEDKKAKYHALLSNTARNGRKTIEFTSNVAIKNQMEQPITLAFSNARNPSQRRELELKHRNHEFCPLSYVDDAMVHVSLPGHEGASFSVKDIQAGSLARYVNLGGSSSAKALYARVTVQTEIVQDTFGKDCISKYTVMLSPVMSLMNLLPMPLEYKMTVMDSNLDTNTLEEGGETKINRVMLPNVNSEVQAAIFVRPEGFKKFSSALVPSVEEGKKGELLWIEDDSGRKLRLSYNMGIDAFGTVTMQVFCDFWLVNCTGEEIIVKDAAKDMPDITLPAVETSVVSAKNYRFDSAKNMKPILFSYANSADKSRALLIRTPTTSYCEGVTIDAIGTNTRTCPPDEKNKKLKEKVFGVKVSNAPSMFTLTKIAVITPGMFFINHTGKDLTVRMGLEDGLPEVALEAGAMVPFHCPAPVNDLVVSVKCDALHSAWTQPMDLFAEENQMMLECAEDATEEESKEMESQQYLLRMRSGMNGAQREVVFDFADAFNTFLYNEILAQGQNSEEAFSYADLLKASAGDNQQEALERMKSVYSSGMMLTEETETEMEMEVEKKKEEDDTLNVKVHFAGFGISIVDAKPQELMYICTKDLDVGMTMADDGQIDLSLSLMKCQIDTGLSIPGSKFNVMFGSLESGEPEDPEQEDSPLKPFISVALSMPSHPTVVMLEKLVFRMQPILCSVNSTLLTALLDLSNQIVVQMQDVRHPGRPILDACEAFAPVNRIAANVGMKYILADDFLLDDINLKFSFYNDPFAPLTNALQSTSSPALMPFMAVANTILGLVGSLDNATIDLKKFELNNHYTDMNVFVKKIVSFYVSEVLKKFYLLVGSFNLIGNPVELVGNLTGGVKAFFSESAKGMKNGPVGIVGGVAKGATKMVGQTAFGVLNSATKITNTVGNSVANFAMDEQFQANRAAGKSNLLNSMALGVTGVFTKTASGLKEEGLIGGVTGLAKGVVGAVAMTATGAIDTVTSVVNTAKDVAHKERILQPVRDPRYIPVDNRLDPYNRYLSNGGVLLQKVNSGNGICLKEGERYVVHAFVNNGADALLLTTQHVVLMTAQCKLTGTASFDVFSKTGSVLRNEDRMHLIPNSEVHSSVRDNLGRIRDGVTSVIAGEIKLREAEVTFESPAVAELMEKLLTQRNSMTADIIADLIRELIPQIHAGASLEDEEANEGENGEDQNGPRAPPSLKDLKLDKFEFKNSHRVVLEGGSKKVTEYEVELTSKEKNLTPAVWSIRFRYNELDDLFKLLKKKCNKEDMKNLHLTSQRLKFLRTKNQRKEAVIRFLKVLFSSANLMKQQEVDEFFKKGAMQLHWKDEEVETELMAPSPLSAEVIPEEEEEEEEEKEGADSE